VQFHHERARTDIVDFAVMMRLEPNHEQTPSADRALDLVSYRTGWTSTMSSGSIGSLRTPRHGASPVG
jgi:hypothetical protein